MWIEEAGLGGWVHLKREGEAWEKKGYILPSGCRAAPTPTPMPPLGPITVACTRSNAMPAAGFSSSRVGRRGRVLLHA